MIYLLFSYIQCSCVYAVIQNGCFSRLRVFVCLTDREMSDQQGVPDQQVAGKSQGGAGAVYKVQIYTFIPLIFTEDILLRNCSFISYETFGFSVIMYQHTLLCYKWMWSIFTSSFEREQFDEKYLSLYWDLWLLIAIIGDLIEISSDTLETWDYFSWRKFWGTGHLSKRLHLVYVLSHCCL